MGWIARSLVLTLVLVAACEPESPPSGPNSADTKPAETGDPVFAYTEPGRLRLMRAGAEIVGLDGDTGPSEWTADGSRFVARVGEHQLVSVDVRTGSIAKAECACYDIAIAAGKVFASADYGATELSVYDAVTLEPQAPLALDGGASAIAGAGDRLVTFQITQSGARDWSDLIIVEPATGEKRKVGSAGQVTETAYTPRGWWGGPLFAYATTGSTGASTAVASVFWLDPTSAAEQVQTSDQELREATPAIADDDWNSARDHLWWASDGTLRTAAWTWSCTYGGLSGPQCTDKSAHHQWRYDGSEWARTDERDLAAVREIGAGASLELGRGDETGVSVEDQRLTLVEGGKRTELSAHVRYLSTPPQLGAPQPGGTGTREAAARFAPTVWLHPDEENFPADPSDYIRRSQLLFDHGDLCSDGEPPVTDLDPDKLGRGEGYPHKAAVPITGTKACSHPDDARTFHSNAPVSQASGRGFYLHPAQDTRPGNRPGADQQVKAPVYWEFVPPKDGYLGAYLYWFFHPYNNFTGDHEGDWERVAVQVDGDRPVAVTFAKHGGPTCYVQWENVETSGSRAVVFGAKGSHGSYPREGDYPLKLHLITGTDHARKGFAWDTSADLHSVRDQPWYGYRGIWGQPGTFGFTTGPAGPWPKRDMSASLTGNECEREEETVPAALVGSWKAGRPTPSPATPLEVRINTGHKGDEVGTVSYPDLGCEGRWTLFSSEADKITVVETRAAGPQPACATTGSAQITRTPDGLHFRYRSDDKPDITDIDLVRAG